MSDNAPTHFNEHNDLMQLVAKVADKCQYISVTILITIGKDGRPIVGGNLDNSAQITEVLRQLVAAEGSIADVYKVAVPKDN